MNKLKNESVFQRFLRKSIGYNFHGRCRFKKNHGNEYSEAGVSDLDGHIDGKYVAIECKMWSGRPSMTQLAFTRSIMKTGGLALFAIYQYEDGEHTLHWVPGDMNFTYRQKAIWPKSKLIKMDRDPNNPGDGRKVDVFDCSPLSLFLMR